MQNTTLTHNEKSSVCIKCFKLSNTVVYTVDVEYGIQNFGDLSHDKHFICEDYGSFETIHVLLYCYVEEINLQ